MQDRPYFMKDRSWYEYDFDTRRFVLTDKAPKQAKRSLKAFYEFEAMLAEGRESDGNVSTAGQ